MVAHFPPLSHISFPCPGCGAIDQPICPNCGTTRDLTSESETRIRKKSGLITLRRSPSSESKSAAKSVSGPKPTPRSSGTTCETTLPKLRPERQSSKRTN